MKVAYFDCFAGASGDMVLGSLVDAGLPLATLEEALRVLPVHDYRLEATKERRGPITGTRVSVIVDSGPKHRRSLQDIQQLIDNARLPKTVQESALDAFTRLATVEAGIHGVPVQDVHFHEVGATDAIVDVVGAFLGLELLGVRRFYCSAFPGGQGTISGSHGTLPLPAPATLGLLAQAQAPVRPAPKTTTDLGELLTPTGAAILTRAAAYFQPEMTLQAVGYGVGTRDHPELPNLLRVWLGEAPEGPVPAGEVQLLETNIDDMNPELYGYVSERLFEWGALDVWWTAIQMKKNRPGTLLSVLAKPQDANTLAAVLLAETSTLGVRTQTLRRWEAERDQIEVATPLGPARVKAKRWDGKVQRLAPEYESCAALARQHRLPLAEVYRIVEAAAWEQAG